jgi:hypothetical protein
MHTFVCKFLDIQYRHLDAPFCKQMYYNLPNTIAASRHDDNFLAPHIRVVRPIVRHCIVQPRADTPEQTQADNCLQMLEGSTMFCCEYIAARSVPGEEYEWKRERWVQDCKLE